MDELRSDRLLLAELEGRLAANRRRAGALRYPLVAVAVVNVAAIPWCLLAGRRRMVLFYLPALLVAMAASWHHNRRLARRTGVLLPLWMWALGALAIVAGAATLSRIGVATGARVVEEAGPALVWVAGYHLLGRWGHNRLLMISTAAMVPATLLLRATMLRGDAFVAAQLVAYGLLLVTAAARTPPDGAPAPLTHPPERAG